MANIFYIQEDATLPSLTTTLYDTDGTPFDIQGGVTVRLKGPYGDTYDFTATVFNQTTDRGKIKVDKITRDPSDQSVKLAPGNYKVSYRADESLDLWIFPTQASPYDVPTVDKVVIQKSL